MSEKSKKNPSWEKMHNWLLAGVAGLSAASIATVATIRDKFYENIKNVPDVQAHLKDSANKLHELWERAPNMTRNDYHKELDMIKSQNDTAFAELMHSHHYRSKGWKSLPMGIFDRASSMSGASQRSIALNAVITAAVAVGGTFMFLNARQMREEIDTLAEKQTSNNQR